MAKLIDDKVIMEGLEMAALAAEDFLKVFYKVKKEMEGTSAPSPRKGLQEKIDKALENRSRHIMRKVLKANQSQI